jgi:hypothetical protein
MKKKAISKKKSAFTSEVVEREYTVQAWFPSESEARAYRLENKYKDKFELLKEVKSDSSRHTNKYYRLYQVKCYEK